MNKKVYPVFALIAFLLAAYMLLFSNNASNTQSESLFVAQESPSVSPSSSIHTNAVSVTFSDTGFTPQTITIKNGTTVVYKNASSIKTWPASAIHPTHRVYPGTDTEKCGTAEGTSMFDACKGIAQNQEWSFTFNEVGTWKYHDHLNPQFTGTVIVE